MNMYDADDPGSLLPLKGSGLQSAFSKSSRRKAEK